jgi:mxaA protein
VRWVAVFLLPLPGLSLAAPAPAEIAAIDPPRSYGYVIGDVIELQWRVTPPPGMKLRAEGLPKPGAVNRWLVLRELQLAEEGDPSPRSYRLKAVYQTFRAPLAVLNLTLPGLPLSLDGPAGPQAAATPDWAFKMAPLRELSVFDADGTAPVRPDGLPPRPDNSKARLALGLSLLAAATAAGWWAYREAWLPYRGRGRHFRQAEAELRHLPAGPDALRTAYACFHRAVNRSFGEPLFAADLERLIGERPDYAPLKEELEAFFAGSYGSFFGAGESPFSLDRLAALCRACRRIEQERT